MVHIIDFTVLEIASGISGLSEKVKASQHLKILLKNRARNCAKGKVKFSMVKPTFSVLKANDEKKNEFLFQNLLM